MMKVNLKYYACPKCGRMIYKQIAHDGASIIRDRLTGKLHVHSINQGKCIVEYDDGLPWGTPRGYNIMFPDGEIRFVRNKKDAENICKRWFKAHIGSADIAIGEIEWRL